MTIYLLAHDHLWRVYGFLYCVISLSYITSFYAILVLGMCVFKYIYTYVRCTIIKSKCYDLGEGDTLWLRTIYELIMSVPCLYLGIRMTCLCNKFMTTHSLDSTTSHNSIHQWKRSILKP